MAGHGGSRPPAQPAGEHPGHHIRVQMADGSWRERILHDLDDPILTMNARVIYARGENRPPNREHVAALRAWVTGEPQPALSEAGQTSAGSPPTAAQEGTTE